MKKPEFNYCIGIDASKENLDLALIRMDAIHQIEHTCIANNQKGLKEIARWLKGFGVEFDQVLFCMEFTGIYNRPLQKHLEKQRAFIWMEMPVRIIKSMGLQRGKNDKLDAKRIAMYAARHQEDKIKWTLPSEEKDAMEDLITLRNRFIRAKNMLLVPVNEMKAMGEQIRSVRIKKHSNKIIQSMDLEIERIEEEIRNLIMKQPAVEKNIRLLKSIPGVGIWTALQVVCDTDNFNRLNTPKQLACYCGCAPFEHRSGTSVRGKSRISHMANKTIKTLLTMGARSVINSKNELGQYYQRKVAEGKNKRSVINAIRNKIIHLITSVVERQTPYVAYATINC